MMRENIIQIFKEAGEQFVSGEELSKRLGVTRAAIWKHIEELRQHGYRFEAVRRSGYRLVSAPDLLTPEEIRYELHTARIGQRIEYREQVESTQLIAHQLAEAGAEEGTLVVADEQTGGRGRLGRSWHSPPGTGIWMSLILRPNMELKRSPQLTLLTAVAMTRSIRLITGSNVQIKWPNDILINKKKICGILTELNAEWDRINYVVIGMGINVNTRKEDFPESLQPIATSLRIETGKPVKRAGLVREFCSKFEELYDLYLQEGFSPIKHLWESHAVSIGKRIAIRTMDGVLEGMAQGIDEDGVLLLQLDNGIIKKIYSADLQMD